MYDHPPARSSAPFAMSMTMTMTPTSSSNAAASSSSSTAKQPRSNSPLPHIATLLPHHHHHHHSHGSTHHQYSPSSRAADISRLLDPSYASHNSSSSSSSGAGATRLPTQAYVDHRGDLHDPDYRDFPVLPLPSQRSSAQKPRRRHTTQPLHHTHSASRLPSATTDRYSTYPLVVRPDWERDWATEIEDLDEDEEQQELYMDLNSNSHSNAYQSPFVRSSSTHTTPSSRRASSVYARSSFFAGEPVSLTSSPVDSLEEDDENNHIDSGMGMGSPFEDLGAEEYEFVEQEDGQAMSSANGMNGMNAQGMGVEEDSASTCRGAGGRTASLLRRIRRSGSSASVSSSAQQSQSQIQQQSQAQQIEREQEQEETMPSKEVADEYDAYYDDGYDARPQRRPRRAEEIEYDEDSSVPSCTHALKQQWRAVSLRLRFGVFHVQRRLATAAPRRRTL